MATLTIKHGARPRYLPKKITNYTYVERGNKRVLDYTYTETNIVPSIDAECVRPAHYPSEAWGLGDGRLSYPGDPTGVDLVASDGLAPDSPRWEYTYDTRTYNSGTAYEFQVLAMTKATLYCGGTTVKYIAFNDQNMVILEHVGSGGTDYHDKEPDAYTLTIYEAYPQWTKKTGDRGNLHTFWKRKLVKTRVIDGQTIYYLGEQEEYELITNAVLGTPVFTGSTTNTAYNCEVKLELEEE